MDETYTVSQGGFRHLTSAINWVLDLHSTRFEDYKEIKITIRESVDRQSWSATISGWCGPEQE